MPILVKICIRSITLVTKIKLRIKWNSAYAINRIERDEESMGEFMCWEWKWWLCLRKEGGVNKCIDLWPDK